MKAQIIQIGNSKGIRLPKAVLEHCRLEGEVEIEVRDEGLVIKSANRSRKGWEDAFQAMAECHDDQMHDLNTVTKWDEREWEW